MPTMPMFIAAGEVPRGIPVAGENRGAVAVFVVHGEADAPLRNFARADGRQDRAKDLLTCRCPSPCVTLSKRCGPTKNPSLVALKRKVAVVDHKLRALFHA